VHYVQDNTPFYRDDVSRPFSRVSRGTLNPGDFQVVDRHLIIPKLNDFMDDKSQVSWRSTSGTTGTPFVFPKDRHASGYMDAVMHRVYGWHGVRVGDKQARLWGSALTTKELLAQKVKDRLLGRKRLSVFHCNRELYARYFATLQAFRPRYFYSYANALYQFALYVEQAGEEGRGLGIPLAICTGEMIFPHQRKKISEVFGCRVINEYGSTESGIIGFECEDGCMHVMPTIYLEVEEPDPDGFGHLLVTELNSRSVPFLRYRIGDMARLPAGDCPCGRPFPRIELGKGRANDQIICPDGTVVYATVLAYVLKGSVQEFRAIQHSTSTLEIQIVPGQGWSVPRERDVKLRLRKQIGIDMDIHFSVCAKIPPEKNGKLRYFISHVSK
jgi:phenylacetate-CoA ligase